VLVLECLKVFPRVLVLVLQLELVQVWELVMEKVELVQVEPL
jgi:hypothetical protein